MNEQHCLYPWKTQTFQFPAGQVRNFHSYGSVSNLFHISHLNSTIWNICPAHKVNKHKLLQNISLGNACCEMQFKYVQDNASFPILTQRESHTMYWTYIFKRKGTQKHQSNRNRSLWEIGETMFAPEFIHETCSR